MADVRRLTEELKLQYLNIAMDSATTVTYI